MKLRELVRTNKKEVKLTLKSRKLKNRDVPDEWVNIQTDGEGDNARRGFNDNEGYIQ